MSLKKDLLMSLDNKFLVDTSEFSRTIAFVRCDSIPFIEFSVWGDVDDLEVIGRDSLNLDSLCLDSVEIYESLDQVKEAADEDIFLAFAAEMEKHAHN